jgi:hypothetical protein
VFMYSVIQTLQALCSERIVSEAASQHSIEEADDP